MLRISSRAVVGLSLGLALCALAGTASANLGSFELNDGYGDFLNEVRQSNQGEFGFANGGPGGVQTPITPGTGLWYGISGTMFPSFNTGATAYATGHSGYQYTGNQGLVITTGCDGWAGPALKYGYRVDSRDLGGVSPAATGGQIVNISFWTRPFLHGTGEQGGLGAGTIGDTVEFVDSLGNVGFSVGLVQPGTTTDYVAFNNTGSYTTTSIVSAGAYSRWDIKLDLALQTVTASYFDGGTSIYTNLLANAPLAASMADFNRLYFESSAGVNNAKSWALDDFSMNATPAPGGVALLGIGAIFAARRRRA